MNVIQDNQPSDAIMMFDLSTNQATIFSLDKKVGNNARLVLTDNDNHLHILGGGTKQGNHKHIKLDLKTMKTTEIYSFEETNPNISEHAALFNKTKNQIYMFGGISFWDFGYLNWRLYDDFWVCDKKLDEDTMMKIIHGWYRDGVPAEIVNIILSYNDYYWYKNDRFKLPKKLRDFGYVLYDDRVIIIFGGDGIDAGIGYNIYYLDLNDDKGWIKSTVELEKSGYYTALFMDKDTIYVLPSCCGHSECYIIKVNKILPQSLMTGC